MAYSDLTAEAVSSMDYVSFMGLLNETNRPPGGKDSLRRMAQNSFLTAESEVLHSGCNTGYCSFELAHLTKCKVTAIDINEYMIKSANARLAREPFPFNKRLSFSLGDAHSLQFADNSFDLVMSGGSTAFMRDKKKVVDEYVRVCKPYGFVGDIFMYYRDDPPQELIEQINSAIGTSIEKWGREYWLSLYTNAGLEQYYVYDAPMPVLPSPKEVESYCQSMIEPLALDASTHQVAVDKLKMYMELFNENHKYLSYAVLLCRKAVEPEQVNLFGA